MKELDKKRWVNTTDVIEFLKSDPDHEHEFNLYLGGMLRSTYWMEYKSDKNMFALSRESIRPDYYTEAELLECYEGVLVESHLLGEDTMALEHLSEAIRKILILSDKCSTSFRIQIKKLITDDWWYSVRALTLSSKES